jgi:hypothetical protein
VDRHHLRHPHCPRPWSILVQEKYAQSETLVKHDNSNITIQSFWEKTAKGSRLTILTTTMTKTSTRPIYHAQCPPSMRMSLAVMNELASLIRNTAAPRYSSGLLNLPSMFCVGHSRCLSGYLTNRASTMAVTMYPGEMVLTRIPCWPHSLARFLDS